MKIERQTVYKCNEYDFITPYITKYSEPWKKKGSKICKFISGIQKQAPLKSKRCEVVWLLTDISMNPWISSG